MDEAALHDLLSGRRRDVGARLLRGALSVASGGYSAVMALRNLAYDRRLLTIYHATVPVISLGNLTTGGTGKTPIAAWLANWLLLHGCRPGLLSRGYRALADAQTGSETPGNDEKRVLDRLCPGVPHLQQRDRVRSARRLVDESDCNVLILDDGFQHRRLHRDLDLVLVDALQPWGFGRVLPRGLLREPRSGLRRAGLVILTRADQCPESDRQCLRNELGLHAGNGDCVEVAFRPQRLTGLDGRQRALESVTGKNAGAFCGIGNPDGFRRTLSSLQVAADLRVFPDHHHYTADDLAELAAMARKNSFEFVLTTLKDLVKIPLAAWTGPPLFAVEIGVQFLQGEELLISRLQAIVDESRKQKG